MKYERLTIKRENCFATVWNTTLQGLIDRLAELEDKIERGELISTVQDGQSEQEIAFFVKHNAEVRKQAVREFVEEFKSRYFFMMTTYMKDPIYQCTGDELDRLVKEERGNWNMEDTTFKPIYDELRALGYKVVFGGAQK